MNKMDPVERYTYAVGKNLPSKKKADIQSELQSNLSESLEARFGANPTEGQVILFLKEYGDPE
jgi:hypothetical protein